MLFGEYTMLFMRSATFLLTIGAVLSQNDSDPKCKQVDGVLSGCNECYPCDHDSIMFHRSKGNVVKPLKLNNNICELSEVCCVEQLVVLSTRMGEECGRRNPDGAGARRRRRGPRRVLEGEYPWAAYLYKKSNKNVICGATYISQNKKALVTTARCVRGIKPGELAVSFQSASGASTASVDQMADVTRIDVHDSYNEDAGLNDIALIFLNSLRKVPKWASPACLPESSVPHATACIAIAENDNFINTVTISGSKCSGHYQAQMCAISPPGDYLPRKGSGLYCESERDSVRTFTLYGLATSTSKNDITIYTNLNNFYDWIDRKLTYVG